MDVAAILLEACERARVTQSELAARAGTSSGAMSQLVKGRVSPTVRTLDRLLAGVGLQLRVDLEQLRGDLDARVDAALQDATPLDAGEVGRVARAFPALQRYLVEVRPGEEPEERWGPVVWGLDGASALRAHELGFAVDTLEVAMLFDEPARAFLFGSRVRGTGGPPVSWFDADLTEAQQHLGSMAVGPFGMVRVRLLPLAPATLRIEVAPGVVVPVLTMEEVERGRPDLAEVLARLRERQAGQLAARSLGA